MNNFVQKNELKDESALKIIPQNVCVNLSNLVFFPASYSYNNFAADHPKNEKIYMKHRISMNNSCYTYVYDISIEYTRLGRYWQGYLLHMYDFITKK